MTNLRKEILELREKGYSYNEIEKELKCSKSTISYHVSKGGKERSYFRTRRFKTTNTIVNKIDNYRYDRYKRRVGTEIEGKTTWDHRFRSACSRYRTRIIEETSKFTYKEALEYINYPDVKCYLTGRKIDIDTDKYHLDHIIPVSKGGDNSLYNMGVTIPEANMMKSDLLVSELLELCKEILENNGYIVNKE